jgi:hypothetical protein
MFASTNQGRRAAEFFVIPSKMWVSSQHFCFLLFTIYGSRSTNGIGNSGILLHGGGIAQLVERQLCKLEVRGSNPLASKSNFRLQISDFRFTECSRFFRQSAIRNPQFAGL